MEITTERSLELANTIESIKLLLYAVDVDYAKAVVSAMIKQANFQDSAAVLNPSYNPRKSELILDQARMLQYIVDFIETGKRVDEKKKKISEDDQIRSNIQKMFL